MATNLGSTDSTSFNTTNMKPESGEQIDALWAQNIGDNLSYLFWGMERKAFDLSVQNDLEGRATDVDGTAFWTKISSHDTLHGTYVFDWASTGDLGNGTFYLDGTVIVASKVTAGSIGGIAWDQSHLTDGEVYAASVHTYQPGGALDKSHFNCSAWSGTFLAI